MQPSRKTDFHAFTIKADGIVNRIISLAKVSKAFDPRRPPTVMPPLVEVQALWDTGANHSVITGSLAKRLNLLPAGKQVVNHGGGQSHENTHIVNIMLPNGVAFSGVLVTELPNVNDTFDLIIGMDIIAAGDFSFTNAGGKSCFSFRFPSKQHIDYVAEWNTRVLGSQKVNDLCYCGSGRKAKKCHGAKAQPR